MLRSGGFLIPHSIKMSVLFSIALSVQFRGVKTEVKIADSHAPCQKEDGSLAVVSSSEFDV